MQLKNWIGEKTKVVLFILISVGVVRSFAVPEMKYLVLKITNSKLFVIRTLCPTVVSTMSSMKI